MGTQIWWTEEGPDFQHLILSNSTANYSKPSPMNPLGHVGTRFSQSQRRNCRTAIHITPPSLNGITECQLTRASDVRPYLVAHKINIKRVCDSERYRKNADQNSGNVGQPSSTIDELRPRCVTEMFMQLSRICTTYAVQPHHFSRTSCSFRAEILAIRSE